MKSQFSNEAIAKIIDAAKRLEIELDEAEAKKWLESIQIAVNDNKQVTFDERTGVFGQDIAMLDFVPERLDYFRKIGKLVEFLDVPGKIETALALSGSSAQSKVQIYPGDCDYFERVNILAETKAEACQILGEIMREKALSTQRGPTFQLIEVKMGSYPVEFVEGKRTHNVDSPISWEPFEIQAGKKVGFSPDGNPLELPWDEMVQNPGWCKLDWIVADPIRGTLANASNMLDVTWEAPDGSITPLDGYLDPYFQEVYLEAESIPLFTKLAKHVSADALDEYVDALEKEVKKYISKDPNYGKAARRMYNIFRLTGRYEAAAYLRELFDEPTTVLYQVSSLIRTIDDTFTADPHFSKQELIDHMDKLITNVIETLEGEEEVEVVRLLMRLRDILFKEEAGTELSPQAEAARAELINIVNNFFYEKLTAIPVIKGYMDEVASAE